MDVKLCRHSRGTLNLLKWRVSVNTAGADKVCWNVKMCVCIGFLFVYLLHMCVLYVFVYMKSYRRCSMSFLSSTMSSLLFTVIVNLK